MVLWTIVAPAAIEPVAWGLPTLFVELPYDELDVVIRTCELDVPAVLVPLFRICQATPSDPPGARLLGLRVTFSGCTSTDAAAVAGWKNRNNESRTSSRPV